MAALARCRSPTASRRRPATRRCARDCVVRALAVHLADRVDRRQVDDVEAHLGDRGQPLGCASAKVPCGRRSPADDRRPRTAGRTRTRSRTARAAGRPTPRSAASVVTSSRTGWSCRQLLQARRSSAGRDPVRSAPGWCRAAPRPRRRAPRGARPAASAATRSNSRAPSSRSLARSSAPWPASILTSTAWCQVASGSLHASTRKVQQALAVGRRRSAQPAVGLRARPASIRRNGGGARRPGGVAARRSAPTASWPSRNTVAVIGSVLADHGAGRERRRRTRRGRHR